MVADQPKSARGWNDKIGIGLIVSAVVLLALIVFVFQNLTAVEVRFLFLSMTFPLWLVAIMFFALGAALGWIWRWMSRRRKKK